ncbi:MAG: hypothetical protein HQL23_01160 [Candidatus Omnitrophica bacterium]|nr:hypothetical protein [Candidatus Omnitrophota bacterium]
MRRLYSYVFRILICLGIFGCSSTKFMYQEIAKDKDTYNMRVFPVALPQLQEAVEKVMLAKKMSIESEDKTSGTISAYRKFSRGYKTIVVVLQSKIVSNSAAEQELFLNGIQTTERNYVEDKTRFFLWLVPLPGGGGKHVTTAKEADVFIDDKAWYGELFDAIQKALIPGTQK